MAVVTYPNGRVREVKNLGWLLRRCYGFRPDGLALAANTFTIQENEDRTATLTARLKDGAVYRTTFQDRGVLRDWLDRPSMQGYPVTWLRADGDSRLHVDIGSDAWRAFEPYEP